MIRETPKIYPAEPPEAMEPIIIYPLDEPGVVGALKREDIDAIWRNHLKLFKWGAINEATLEEINKASREKLDEIRAIEEESK